MTSVCTATISVITAQISAVIMGSSAYETYRNCQNGIFVRHMPFLITKALTKYLTRNKSNFSDETRQYWQDMFPISHYNRKNFPTYTCCSENHNNMCAENRKIRGLKFDTL